MRIFFSVSPYYVVLCSFKAGSYKSMEAQNLKRLDLYLQGLTATLHRTNFISLVLVLFSDC